MRTDIVHPSAEKLRYEIRQIVDIARQIEKQGMPIVWENIGDPVAKGEQVPEWIREIVGEAVRENSSYAYSPTKGLPETLSYIAAERNLEGGIQITPDDILFFNGLGDAITHIYTNMHPHARVIGPNPAYPTHACAEAAHAGAPHLTYRLLPEHEWEPDLDDLEQKINTHHDIAGIIIINPDNPTGFVYSQTTIRKTVALARKYGLFIISDEIYSNLAYEGSDMQKLASVIDEVPGIALRGISKEFPWPGARCGWVEFYNRDKDASFDRYARSLLDAKMLEVCSTTLPQRVLPSVMGDARYYPYLAARSARYSARSALAARIFSEIPELIVTPARGAFYQSVVFKKGALRANQTLPLSGNMQAIIAPHLPRATNDQRFVYYLLAATGMCVVPLSIGFNSDYDGFRMTLLEPDEVRFTETLEAIARAARAYLAS